MSDMPCADVLRALISLNNENLRLLDALSSACVIAHGRACFKTANGIPMGMPKSAERLVRAALKGNNP